MNEIKILLADDQALILDGIKVILESEETFKVVGAARDGIEALSKMAELRPDLVLLDIRMPGMNGVECTKEIKERFPEVVVMLLTTFDDEEYIMDAFRYGASGYILKDITSLKLIEAVKDAARGEFILPGKIAVKLAQGVQKKRPALVNSFDFTDRETEIAGLLARGYTNKQIAMSLSFSEGTVKNTVSTIYSKINIFDRAQAAIYLKENGF